MTSSAPTCGCTPICSGVAILPNVDALDRHARAGEQSAGQRILGAGKREHRAVVVRVGVDVEQACGSGGRERLGDRLDCRLSATLGDVWDG